MKSKICEHVYKNIGTVVCPQCKIPLREIDWKAYNKYHEQWKVDNPDVDYEWWSI